MIDALLKSIIVVGVGILFTIASMYLLATSGVLKQILLILNAGDDSGIRGLGFNFFIFFALFGLGSLIGLLVARKFSSK